VRLLVKQLAEPTVDYEALAAGFVGYAASYGERHPLLTRSLLESRGLEWIESDTSQPEHLAEFSARLPRSRTLPQLFIAGEHIGSWEDLLAMDGDGPLAALTTGSD
jgi:glutaredoxin 3